MAEGVFGTSQLQPMTTKEAEFLQKINTQSQHGNQAKDFNIHIKWHALIISLMLTERAEIFNALLIRKICPLKISADKKAHMCRPLVIASSLPDIWNYGS